MKPAQQQRHKSPYTRSIRNLFTKIASASILRITYVHSAVWSYTNSLLYKQIKKFLQESVIPPESRPGTVKFEQTTENWTQTWRAGKQQNNQHSKHKRREAEKEQENNRQSRKCCDERVLGCQR